MTVQQPNQSKVAPETPASKIVESDKSQLEPGLANSMDKFNNALRKILSAPKKNINKK